MGTVYCHLLIHGIVLVGKFCHFGFQRNCPSVDLSYSKMDTFVLPAFRLAINPIEEELSYSVEVVLDKAIRMVGNCPRQGQLSWWGLLVTRKELSWCGVVLVGLSIMGGNFPVGSSPISLLSKGG